MIPGIALILTSANISTDKMIRPDLQIIRSNFFKDPLLFNKNYSILWECLAGVMEW